jgi:hypothetical protein
MLAEIFIKGWGHSSSVRVPISKHKALSSNPSTAKKKKKEVGKVIKIQTITNSSLYFFSLLIRGLSQSPSIVKV